MSGTNRKFSVMWANNTAFTRSMSTFRVTLRDPMGDRSEHTAHGGITCGELYLDQVHIKFRPTDTISTGEPPFFAPREFIKEDDSTMHWRAETMELYVAITPGVRYSMFTQRAQTEYVDESENGTVVQPNRTLQYSSALYLTPGIGMDGDNFWNRTYRPLRDIPVAYDLNVVSELTIELLWPLLQGDDRVASWQVPDYRILSVICDFSLRV
jgi:hypothetical protein